MTMTLELILRLVLAGLLGGIIGYEREIRAKGAGIRTHFLVALASALFMLVSQYGFEGTDRFDAARIAAQVVSGVGFIGAGIIIFQKNSVRGLTTAAGLWVTSAIGLSIASGMYVLALVTTALVLICLETMHFYTVKSGDRVHSVTLSSPDEKALTEAMRQLEGRIEKSIFTHEGSVCKLDLILRSYRKETVTDLIDRLSSFNGVVLESLE